MPKEQITIECPACRGQGHVEGYPCRCKGWGRLRVAVLGPCDRLGVVKTTTIEDDPQVNERLRRLLVKIKGV